MLSPVREFTFAKNRLGLAKVIVKNIMSRFYGSVCISSSSLTEILLVGPIDKLVLSMSMSTEIF